MKRLPARRVRTERDSVQRRGGRGAPNGKPVHTKIDLFSLCVASVIKSVVSVCFLCYNLF